jgi:hypothetical protein
VCVCVCVCRAGGHLIINITVHSVHTFDFSSTRDSVAHTGGQLRLNLTHQRRKLVSGMRFSLLWDTMPHHWVIGLRRFETMQRSQRFDRCVVSKRSELIKKQRGIVSHMNTDLSYTCAKTE